MELEFVGEPANHELSWNTTSNYYYHVDCSPDLTEWAFTGLSVPGTGSRVTYGFMSDADKLFYRVRVTADPNDGGFLVKPEQDDTINQIDGVCFAFDLSGLSSLPEKIRIFERDYVDTSPDNNGNPWNLIGSITEFANRQIPAEQIDVDFVRGSAVWLPQEQGEYEVQAAAVDSSGTVLATAVRRITISEQAAPTISIVSGPSSPSSTAVNLDNSFELDHSDTVRRVEFYHVKPDNSRVLLGTATREPFEETVLDLQGEEVHNGLVAHYSTNHEPANLIGRYEVRSDGSVAIYMTPLRNSEPEKIVFTLGRPRIGFAVAATPGGDQLGMLVRLPETGKIMDLFTRQDVTQVTMPDEMTLVTTFYDLELAKVRKEAKLLKNRTAEQD